MLAAPFTGGVSILRFTRCSRTCCEMYGDERAYGIAGLAAAIVAGAQIAGGLVVPHSAVFGRRTTLLLSGRRSAPSCSQSSGSRRISGGRSRCSSSGR